MSKSPNATGDGVPRPDSSSTVTSPTNALPGALPEGAAEQRFGQPVTQGELAGERGTGPQSTTPASSGVAMFNSTQSLTIIGGTFNNVQGVTTSGILSSLASGTAPRPNPDTSVTTADHNSQSSPVKFAPAAPRGDDILRSEKTPNMRRDSDIYHDSLLEKGRGSPLWTPQPNKRLPIEYRRTGTSIGDVGIIKGDGAFSFFFNILLPADHPINRGKVPSTFVPLLLDLSDDIEESDVTDTYIASKSVTRSNTFEENGLAFQSSAAEGAILTTPGGAYSTNLENRTVFENYAKEHSASWYEYVNGPRGRKAQNGDIRLVYGTDKAEYWGMATFSSREERDVRLEFRKLQSTGSYTWNCHGAGASRVGPRVEEHEGLVDVASGSQKIINQSVFIRTISIKLSDTVWKEKIAQLVTNTDGDVVAGEEHKGDASLGSGPSDATLSSGRLSKGKQASKAFASKEVKDRDAISHPCDVLNNLLLFMIPYAQVAISDDADWTTISEEIISQSSRKYVHSTNLLVDTATLLNYLSRRLLYVNGCVSLSNDRRKKDLVKDLEIIKYDKADFQTRDDLTPIPVLRQGRKNYPPISQMSRDVVPNTDGPLLHSYGPLSPHVYSGEFEHEAASSHSFNTHKNPPSSVVTQSGYKLDSSGSLPTSGNSKGSHPSNSQIAKPKEREKKGKKGKVAMERAMTYEIVDGYPHYRPMTKEEMKSKVKDGKEK